MSENKLNGIDLKGIWDTLTDEQKEKARECKSLDELIEFAGKEGIELPDEMLDSVAGGYIMKGDEEGTWIVIRDDYLDVHGKYYKKEWAMRGAEDEGYSSEEITYDEWKEMEKNQKKC